MAKPYERMQICEVHNHPRLQSHCYQNYNGEWECRTSCQTLALRERVGNDTQSAPTLMTALSISEVRESYKKSSARLGPAKLTQTPLEFCAVHSNWRTMEHLKLNIYGDYECTAKGACTFKHPCTLKHAGNDKAPPWKAKAHENKQRDQRHRKKTRAKAKERHQHGSAKAAHAPPVRVASPRQRESTKPSLHPAITASQGASQRQEGKHRRRGSPEERGRSRRRTRDCTRSWQKDNGNQAMESSSGEDSSSQSESSTVPGVSAQTKHQRAPVPAPAPAPPAPVLSAPALPSPKPLGSRHASRRSKPTRVIADGGRRSRSRSDASPTASAQRGDINAKPMAARPNSSAPSRREVKDSGRYVQAAMLPASTQATATPGQLQAPQSGAHVALYSGPEADIMRIATLHSRHDCRGIVWPEENRAHSGQHPEARKFVREHPVYEAIEREVARKAAEVQSQPEARLKIGVFDRRGKYASVSVSEELATKLRANGHLVTVIHLSSHHWPCQRGACAEC